MADILSVLIGGGFALGGAYLGPFMQSRQRREDARQAKETLLRTKAQELFVLIVELNRSSVGIGQQIINHEKASVDQSFGSYAKVAALALTYFPELHAHFDRYKDAGRATIRQIQDDDLIPVHQKVERIGAIIEPNVLALCGGLETELIRIVRELDR